MVRVHVENGLLRTPELHDAVLCGFVVTPGRELRLFVERAGSDAMQLVLPATRYLRAENVREGNVVFDVHVFCGAGDVRPVIAWVLEHDGPARPRDIDHFHRAVIAREATVLEITTSYGCRLGAIAEVSVDDIVLAVR